MKTKIRILHIDDNLLDRQIVKNVLQKEPDEFEVIETENRLEFELHLNKSDFDLILSEFNIPGLEGLNVLQLVKEKKPGIPVIIVTGKGSEEIAAEAMKLGAADYVIKSEKHIHNLSPIIRKVIENRKIKEEQNTTLTELRKSEERFRLLFDTSMDGILLTQSDGAIIKANNAACNIFGRTEEEIKQIGRNGILDIADPQLAIALEERSRTGKYNGVLTALRKDGTPFPIEISSALFQDNDGNLRSSMVIRDITERKRVEKSLEENEKLYRNLFESLLNGFAYCRMLFDKERPVDFIYLKVNKAFESFTGLKDVVGKRVSEVVPGIQISDPKLFEIYGRVALTGKPETFEIYLEALKLWFLISVYSPQKEYFVAIFDVITERKLSEEAILKERNLLRTLIDNLPVGVFVKDKEYRKIIVNSIHQEEIIGHLKHLGLNSEVDIVGKTDFEVFPKELADKFFTEDQKVIQDGSLIINNEGLGFNDEGNQIILLVSKIPLQANNGEIIGMVGVTNDITERKRIEEILHISEEKFRNVFEYSVEGKSITTMDGKIKTNKAYRDILGYSEEELLNLKWEEITHRDDIENDKKNGQSVVSGEKESANWEKRYIHKNGNIVWVDISISLQRDDEGNPLYFITSINNITEKKLAFEAIKATEIRYRRLFESAKDGILILDAETGMIVDVNPYLVELLGYSTEQFHGKKIWEIGVFSDIIANQAKFLELQQKKYVRYEDLPLKTNDGRHIDVEFVSNVYEVNHHRVIQCNIRNITERKKAEEQRMIQTTALEAAAFSVVITDAEGTITWVNNAFTMMTGYSKEEVIGKNPRILKSGMHDKSFYKNMWDTVKAGNVWHGEVFNKRKDNSILTDEMTITPVRDKNGIVQNFIALKQDITERRQISESLRESEQLLSKTQKFAHIGSFNYFFNSNEVKWSDEMYHIMGLQKDTFKVTAESFINCIHPEDRNSMFKWIEQTSNGINPKELDFRIVKPDGTIRHISGNGILQGDKDSKLLQIFGSAQDITERINIENALKESEMKFRSILENSADAIFITDPMGRYIYTNKAVTDLLGYTSEQMLIKTIVDLAPKDKIESFFEMFKVVLNKGKCFVEIELLKNDGNFVSTDLNAVLLPNGFVYASCRDITLRKEAEVEIHNLNATLERKVEERTKKLSEVNINLIEAKAQAEQANQAKSVFLSNMSHEIRTPMNAVLGYTELLNNILEDKTQKDYLKSIMSSGKTLLTLINDILDLSKIEAGKLELTFDYVNTHSFFSEFERMFSWKVEEKGLTFILDIVSGIPAGIYIDETRLRQIILNIIGNAVKFTQKGHIKLKVYIENPKIVKLSNKKTEEYIDLVIEVEDTGIGISSEFQDHIFEPFSQEQHENLFGGTGLGLAITRRLLSLMNGTISLQSKLNKGTTIQIKIPDIAYLRDFERTTDSIQIDPANIVFEKATILIIDDIAHNRKYFADALKNTNIEIVEAEDGQKGYSLANDIVPDLVITDLRMPKLNGFGLLKKIQGNKKLSHIPVIAYSASVMKEQKEKVFNCKFSGLLIKPVSVTDLYIELMNYLPYTSTITLEKDHSIQKESLKQIIDIQGLVHSLETVYTDVWKKFEVRQPIDEVREFGENLENLGNSHNAEIIKEYGNELMIAAENFNIESILMLLNKYQVIVNEIKEYQSAN